LRLAEPDVPLSRVCPELVPHAFRDREVIEIREVSSCFNACPDDLREEHNIVVHFGETDKNSAARSQDSAFCFLSTDFCLPTPVFFCQRALNIHGPNRPRAMRIAKF